MNINDVLSKGPEALAALSEAELQALLKPYINATRMPVLPDERPAKVGVEHRLVLSALAKNKDAIAALKAAMK